MSSRSILVFLLATAAILVRPARADLQLQQKAVIGFPFDGVIDVAQTGANDGGAHRLAVLHESYLLGLQWSPQRNGYDQTFFVQEDFRTANMILADVNGDGRDDIVVYRYQKDTVAAYDAVTGAPLTTFRLAEAAEHMVAQDLDAAPGGELLVLDSGLSAYKGGVRLWHATVQGNVATATRAAAARGEVFVATATAIVVLDARTGEERRRLPVVCGSLAAGQSDGDAAPELACVASYFDLMLVDGGTGAVQWTQPVKLVQSVAMFDANGDGVDDVVARWFNDGFRENLSVLDGATGAKLGVTRALQGSGAVAAVSDGCEPASIVAVEGGGTSFLDNLWLFDAATLDAKSVFAFSGFQNTGFAVADFDGDGRNELAVAHDGRLSTMRVEPLSAETTVTFGEAWASFRGMAAARLGGGAPRPVIAGSCGGYVGCVRAWDAQAGAPLWSGRLGDQEMPQSVVIADVDGDGAPDVLTSSIDVASGANGRFVYAFRGRDGKQLWRSVNIPGSDGLVLVADVEGNGTPEALALSSTVGVVRLNVANGTVKGFYEMPGFYNFAAVKLPGDARAKLVLASTGGLAILDGGQVKVQDREAAAISAMAVADVDGDGTPELIVTQRAAASVPDPIRLQIRALDTLAPLWTSDAFPGNGSAGNVLQIGVADIDNDGADEVVVLTPRAVRVFKRIAAPATILPRFDPAAALAAVVDVRSACCATVTLHWDHAQPGGAPPLQYRVYRAGTHGEPEVLLATTRRNELVDSFAGGGDAYRYSVAVVDGAGNVAGRLTATVTIGSGARCRRPAGKP